MKITGKLISIIIADWPAGRAYPVYKDNGELLSRISINDLITIELPEVDINKIKVGDRILSRAELKKRKPANLRKEML